VRQVLELSSPRVIVSLRDASSKQRPLKEQTVFLTADDGRTTRTVPVITDFAGRAELPLDSHLHALRSVTAAFGGTVDLGGGQSVTLDSDRYESSRTDLVLPPLHSPFAAVLGNLLLVADSGWPTPPAQRATLALAAADSDGDGPTEPVGVLSIDLPGSDFGFRTALIESVHVYRSLDPLIEPNVRAEIDGAGRLKNGGVFRFKAIATSGRLGASRGFEIRLWTTPGPFSFSNPTHRLRGMLEKGEILIQ
jgi:hypothetical protein